MIKNNTLVLGKLTKPFGINGAIKVRSFSSCFEPFFSLQGSIVSLIKKSCIINVVVQDIFCKGKFLMLVFEGFRSPEKISTLSGFEIFIERSLLRSASKDEFFLADLIGLKLVFKKNIIGKVDGYYETCHVLLDILTDNGSHVLIPFISVFIGDIDIDNKTIELLDDRLI